MKYLFLDIDGVLNSEDFFNACHAKHPQDRDYDREIDPRAAALLDRIARDTGARIILSSSWRVRMAETARALRDAGLNTPVSDCTPTLPTRIRGKEIEAFLRCHPYTQYAILDDDSDFLPEQEPHLVRTLWKTGFTPEDAKKAIEILNADAENL